MPDVTRRNFTQTSLSSVALATFCGHPGAAAASPTESNAASVSAGTSAEFRLKYLLGACMYGYLYLGEILPEVTRCGGTSIDLWPKVHGNQREQLQDLGEDVFGRLLEKHGVDVGCLTQYVTGPYGLKDDLALASRLRCPTIVTGGPGPKGLAGKELRSAVAAFIEKMKPQLETAQSSGITIAIENHANNLFESADSLRYLAELRPNSSLGVALAPYHLPQDSEQLAQLIRDLGPAVTVFYAWQHGNGCMQRLPKEQELLQMPGRGPLDFGPLLKALREIRFQGWTEIFMHPVPRGIPIMETAAEVTAEINRSREYLEKKLAALPPGN